MLMFLIALIVTNASEAVDFRRYHRTVGIPAAQRRLEMERRIMESVDDAVNTRIIGGHKANHLEFPWLAGLLITVQKKSSLCSGSLITSSRVVTAAHCWKDDEKVGIYVDIILGSDFIFYGGTRIRSYDVIVHPGSSGSNPKTEFSVDAALILFPNATSLSQIIKPIALPTAYKSQSFAGYASFAAGFGRIHNKPNVVNAKQNRYVELEVLPDTECNFRKMDHALLCTSGKGKVGACHGDSGGPLSTKICGQDILIGIMIRIELDDCESGATTRSVRVTEVMDWINLHIS